MPGSNKMSQTGPSKVISLFKNPITQDYDESTKSSLQNTFEHSRLLAQHESNKEKYSNLGGNTLLQDSDNSTDDGS
eukprot:3363743-Ditylum_brightwellii.AAC.1